MPSALDDAFRALVAGDVPVRHLTVLATDIAPDADRAAALIAYDEHRDHLSCAFFHRTGAVWDCYGEAMGAGCGTHPFGGDDDLHPYVAGREPGATEIEARLGDAAIRRPAVDGYYMAVFWDVAIAAQTPPVLRGFGFRQTVTITRGPAPPQPERPVVTRVA